MHPEFWQSSPKKDIENKHSFFVWICLKINTCVQRGASIKDDAILNSFMTKAPII